MADFAILVGTSLFILSAQAYCVTLWYLRYLGKQFDLKQRVNLVYDPVLRFLRLSRGRIAKVSFHHETPEHQIVQMPSDFICPNSCWTQAPPHFIQLFHTTLIFSLLNVPLAAHRVIA